MHLCLGFHVGSSGPVGVTLNRAPAHQDAASIRWNAHPGGPALDFRCRRVAWNGTVFGRTTILAMVRLSHPTILQHAITGTG